MQQSLHAGRDQGCLRSPDLVSPIGRERTVLRLPVCKTSTLLPQRYRPLFSLWKCTIVSEAKTYLNRADLIGLYDGIYSFLVTTVHGCNYKRYELLDTGLGRQRDLGANVILHPPRTHLRLGCR